VPVHAWRAWYRGGLPPLFFFMPALFHLLVLDPKLRKWRLGLAIALYLAILVIGSIPGERHAIGQFAPGVVLHSLAYAGLATLWFTGSTGDGAQRALKAVFAIALMGAGDEFVQSFFPYRGAAVADWLVDCVAAVVAATVLWAILPKRSLQP
jgi:VanZ family protein